MFQGLRDRFLRGRDWEDTRYYEFARRKFESDGEWLGYTSFDAFEENRLPYLDRVYRDIVETGYRTQAELTVDSYDETRHGLLPAHHTRINEITCNVARDGTLLLNNGIHRMGIVKSLGLDRVPIQILVRHERWQEIRTAVARADDPTVVASDYDCQLSHPDLAGEIEMHERPTAPAD